MPRVQDKGPSASAARKGARSGCKLCNNLSPRGHASSSYNAESSTRVNANLTLCIGLLQLSTSTCQYCQLLRQSLQAFVGKEWSRIRAPLCIDLLEGSPIKMSVQESNGKSTAIELYAPSDQRPPWSALGHARSIPIHSGSDESFEFARKCIKDCMSNSKHGACRESSPSTLPTRLIDVQGNGQGLKLVELKGKKVEYTTLSYCWGSGSAVTTTSRNLEEMRENIDLDTLPVLFQDAVTITRRLNVHYLWIDGLCIIQDNKEDWETESARMSDIYEASYVTIAADTCEDNSHSCLMHRPKRLRLKHLNTRGKAFTIKARKVLDHHEVPEEDLAFRAQGPLRARAWALQENVLSPRILHYTETELTFECRSIYRCECNPLPSRNATTPGLLPKLLSAKHHPKIFRTWHRIVAQYTLRKLTVASDKLPAISGIAKKVQTATRSAYLAGLWKENLVEDLLWASAPHLESPHLAQRLGEYRAPSFSWASVDTQIQPFEDYKDEDVELNSHISITKASCTVSGLNPLGEVTDGAIDLCGPLAEATLVAPERYKFRYQLMIAGSRAVVDVSPDSLLVEDSVEDETGSPRAIARRGKEGESYKPFKAPVWCLSIAGHSHGCISGLVLTKSSRAHGAYERIGQFTCGSDWLVGAKKQKIKIV